MEKQTERGNSMAQGGGKLAFNYGSDRVEMTFSSVMGRDSVVAIAAALKNDGGDPVVTMDRDADKPAEKKIVARCSTCGEPLTESTVYIGDHAMYCPIHAFWARKRPDERPQVYICVDCGDVVVAADVWMADDGPRCEYCGRHQRIMSEAV